MKPLRYSINVTLDGCCDHEAITPDEEMHRHAERGIAEADALIFGRVVYQLMEAGWREVAETGVKSEWMTDWMLPFATTIHAAKKYVVSDSLDSVDWNNSELVRGPDLEATVRRLKKDARLATGGVMLPLALAKLGLIDEYEFIVHPRLVGYGPTLLAGLPKPVDLKLVGRTEFGSGAVVMRYEAKR